MLPADTKFQIYHLQAFNQTLSAPYMFKAGRDKHIHSHTIARLASEEAHHLQQGLIPTTKKTPAPQSQQKRCRHPEHIIQAATQAAKAKKPRIKTLTSTFLASAEPVPTSRRKSRLPPRTASNRPAVPSQLPSTGEVPPPGRQPSCVLGTAQQPQQRLGTTSPPRQGSRRLLLALIGPGRGQAGLDGGGRGGT